MLTSLRAPQAEGTASENKVLWLVNSMFEKNQETDVTDAERGEKIRKRPGLGVRWRAL